MADGDRRQPLGGVTKEAFVHGGGNELTYDLLRGIKSDLCYELKRTQEMLGDVKAFQVVQPGLCDTKFVTRKQFFVGVGFVGTFLTGFGILNWKEILSLFKHIF